MDKEFLRIKQRAKILLIINACVFGIIAGLVGLGLPLLLMKLITNSFNMVVCVVCLLSCLLVTASLILIIGWPRNATLAKSLDSKISRERVQTMLFFKDKDLPIYNLHKEKTAEMLSALPPQGLSLKCIVTMVIAGVLSVALAITALAIPLKPIVNDDDTTTDEVFVFTEWQKERLKALIAYVDNSSIVTNAKTTALKELNDLYEELLTVTTRPDMVKAVTDCMVVIDDKIEEINVYEEIMGALIAESESVMSLAKALGKVTEIPNKDTYRVLLEDYLTKEPEYFSNLANGIMLAGLRATAYKDSEIFKSVAQMQDAFTKLAGALTGVSDEEARALLINATMDASVELVFEASSQEATNRTVGDTIISELMFIFDIKRAELPETILDNGVSYEDSSGNYEEKEDDKLSDGGGGRDELNFGSDDEVYDPDQQARVKYKEIFVKYRNMKNEKVNEGSLPEEYSKMIDEYFTSLYTGD